MPDVLVIVDMQVGSFGPGDCVTTPRVSWNG